MNRFALATPKTYKDAADLLKEKRFKLPVLKGGGVDLIDHLKEGLIEPDLVVNVRRVRSDGGAPVSMAPASPSGGGAIRIEASATLAEIALSEVTLTNAPVLAQAAGNAASPQVRNMGTAAGNLLQRPRCWYYRHEQFDCLKKGGPTCYAVAGENKYHAIFGDGPCHIVHPSNLAPALMMLDAVVHVIGGDREQVAIADLFHMPDVGVRSEHNLKPGEVITHITCGTAKKSGFYAIKEKQSFDWPLACGYAALEMDGDVVRSARVCAGAVAPVPWMLPNVAAALKGVSVSDDAALRKACAVAAEGAIPMTDNAYKVKLLPVAVRRAVLIAAEKKTEVDV
jgi:xanthine dehydrogenase YagS FAD-binding subunit